MNEFVLPRITTGSFSRLLDYEKCALMAVRKHFHKEKGLQSEKGTVAMERGVKIHNAAEAFVKGEGEMTKEMKRYEDKFLEARDLYKEGLVIVEEDWGFDSNWEQTGWWDDNVWLRVKIDRIIFKQLERIQAEMTDYKSGKKFGNEVKHGQQGQLYVISAFMRIPTLEEISVQFEYLDQNDKPIRKTYSREKAMKFMPGFDRRLHAMTDAQTFPPKPNKMNCLFCQFGHSNGDKSCEWAAV